MEDAKKNALLRTLPSIDELLSRPSLAALLAPLPRPLSLAALRRAVEGARARLLRGEEAGFQDDDVRAALAELSKPNLRPVFNATGVVLHTNLGRAPLAARAAERVREIAVSYSNLEYDLDEGERGSRYAPVVGLLVELTGAEDAVVVNNNAAAVLLVLASLCAGREAIVSRGELVEIGGGFRIPEVMRQSGALLVEVGTTNRTRPGDYAAAIGPQTGLLVKVHRSNFAVVGFTEEATARELSSLGRERGVPLFEDLGSGCLVMMAAEGLTSEPTVKSAISAGADVVTFSGDKLLGGPQAGIIVGKKELLAKVRKHSLNRAVRVDKMTVAGLEATLELYRDGRLDELPVYRLLVQRPEELQRRAERLWEALAEKGVSTRVVATVSQVGGGAMPLAEPRSYACALGCRSPQALHELLRAGSPPVVARVAEEQLLLDVRCLTEDDVAPVAQAVAAATRDSSC
ncbi:MAG: L-seryl-tRNA(Sec) selenium transferase [Myxococcales bacterium]|nr:L-seryl-tRNA(Sec) selenium transferase [Myxococcales bacterium]